MPNFPAVLDSAGITADQRHRVQKAQELLKRLPPGTTPALKRRIVEATLAAFELEMDDVVGAARAHVEALDAYVESRRRTKQQAIDDGDARVRELQSQIAEVRAHTEGAVLSEEAKEDATLAEIGRIRPVIAFFLDAELVDPVIVVESGPSDPAEGDPVLVDLYVDEDDDDEDVELELDLDPDPGPEDELPSKDRAATVTADVEAAPFEPELRPRRPADEETRLPLIDEG